MRLHSLWQNHTAQQSSWNSAGAYKCRHEGENMKNHSTAEPVPEPSRVPACLNPVHPELMSTSVSSSNTTIVSSSLPLLSDYTSYMVLGHILLLTTIWCNLILPKMCCSLFVKRCAKVLPITPHWILLVSLWCKYYDYTHFPEEKTETWKTT